MDNRIIKSALLFCKSILYLIYILLAAFMVMIIYWHFDPAAFTSIEVSDSYKAGFGSDMRYITSVSQVAPDAIYLSELSYPMMYWLIVRNVFFFGLYLIIIKKIIGILYSIESVQTFYEDNVRIFKDLAKLGFIGAAVSCFNFMYLAGEFNISLTIPFAPLLFAVSCLVMAEVFNEGRRLLEDKNLIV